MSQQAEKEKRYLKELNKGSYNAFNALYGMYSGRLYAFVLKMTKSHDHTADIVQDVFIKIWLKRTDISPDRTFRAYLFTIAKNRVIDCLRQNLNSPVFSDYVVYLNEKGNSSENISGLLAYNDFIASLEKAKDTLSDTQRRIFEMNREQGMKNGEIAEKLCLSEQTVKNQLSVSLKILRQKMKNYSYLFSVFFIY